MRTKRFPLRFRRPAVPLHQRVLPFVRRVRRRDRVFKRVIVAATCLAVAAILCASPRGRYGMEAASSEARRVFERALGVPQPRSEVDAGWARFREQGIRDSARAHEQVYRDADPAIRRLLRYGGMDPETALLRWGNYNLTLLLPSTVFEPDDEGRSYRFRPSMRSIWVRNLTIRSGVLMLFLVPDRPELTKVLEGTGGIPVLSSRQTTNSWGLRGPEPDLEAPLRVLVLGDSYMQGMFIGDDDTPPECLRRYLQGKLAGRVSVLNTGVLGYSPEQYYYSLTAFADRYRPNFVLASIFTNDFGDLHDVPGKGIGDWDEGKYWLEKIATLCRAREWPFLIVAVPYKPAMLGRRRSGNYPGLIANALAINSLSLLDPTDDFIDAHLTTIIEGERSGHRPQGCPLYNDAIGDGHFSPAGSRVWAERVGRRILLVLEEDRVRRQAAGIAPRTPGLLPGASGTVEAPR